MCASIFLVWLAHLMVTGVLLYCCFSEAEWKSPCDWSTAWFWSIHESCHWRSCGRMQNWWKEPHWHGGMWLICSVYSKTVVQSAEHSLQFLYDLIFLGPLLRVDLITLEVRGGNVHPSVGMSLHIYVCPQSFFNFNEIWYVDRGRALMHDGMPYDPIQGQGHFASEVPKIALFKVYLLCHLQRQLPNDNRFLN